MARTSKRYQDLVAAVERAINDADPIGLLADGAPSDEYASEIGTIIPLLANAHRPDDVTGVLHQEFLRWFGEGTAGVFRQNKIRIRVRRLEPEREPALVRRARSQRESEPHQFQSSAERMTRLAAHAGMVVTDPLGDDGTCYAARRS